MQFFIIILSFHTTSIHKYFSRVRVNPKSNLILFKKTKIYISYLQRRWKKYGMQGSCFQRLSHTNMKVVVAVCTRNQCAAATSCILRHMQSHSLMIFNCKPFGLAQYMQCVETIDIFV